MSHSADTRIDVPELNNAENRAILRFTTHKPFSGGLVSSVHIAFCSDGMETFTPFSDFSVRLLYVRDARATQKAIDTQHAHVFTPEKIAELRMQALAHYKKSA